MFEIVAMFVCSSIRGPIFSCDHSFFGDNWWLKLCLNLKLCLSVHPFDGSILCWGSSFFGDIWSLKLCLKFNLCLPFHSYDGWKNCFFIFQILKDLYLNCQTIKWTITSCRSISPSISSLNCQTINWTIRSYRSIGPSYNIEYGLYFY